MDLLAQMATFVAVVDGKSLSAAARAQRLSLPAVSRQLQALEQEPGSSLITRSTRRLRVTDAGQRWYEHCRHVLRQVDEAVDSMRQGGAAHGRLVVSASLTFGAAFIVPQLQKLTEAHPHLTIDLRLEDHLVDLIGEGVDVAVRSGSAPPLSTAYVAQRIFGMRRVLVAAPRWLRRHGSVREPEQLTRHECLIQVTPGGVVVPWALHFRGEEAEHVPDVRGRIRTNAPSALRSLALDGAGVAYLPEWLVFADIEAGALRRVLPDWASVELTSWAVYRAELRGSPRLRAFLDALPKGPAQRSP